MSRRALIAALVVLSCAAAACASSATSRGVASCYGRDALRGLKTANGERYDPDLLTCAHRSLPFGTRIEVTVRRTGAAAVCRVNDRGPFVAGRIIDLSYAMAKRLGIVEAGIAEVDLRVLDTPGSRAR
jgi:rare lipoprotein A